MRARPAPGGPDLDPDSLTDAVTDAVTRHWTGGNQPGLVYGVVHRGRLVVAGSRGVRRLGGGPPDAGTAFRIASMTKSFTAATVLLLRDAGLLRLDDRVDRYVPEAAALHPPTDDAPPLTVRDLLTMTAGLPTDDPWGDRQQDLPDDAFGALVARGLTFAWTPGTAYEYSNTGYALLGRVVARAAGRPYADVVRERLLVPLGLGSTVFTTAEVAPDRLAQGYRQAPDGGWEEVPFAGHGAYASMGGLFSTLADLAGWVGGLCRAFPPRDGAGGDHPLARASRREQQQPHRLIGPSVAWRSVAEPPAVRAVAYGFGLVVEQDPDLGEIVGHGGGYPGFGTHMRWHPASGVGAVVLANATYAPSGRLTADLLEAVLRADGPRRAAGAAGPVPHPADPAAAMPAATAAARAGVEALLQAWDDALAARLLAPNVADDEPLPRRRAAIERIRAELGPLVPEADGAWSGSPAHAGWWLRGPGGRVRVEIRMTPQVPPLVQTLSVTAVPHPPAPVRALADRLAAALGTPDPALPPPWTPPPGGADDVARTLRVAAAWAGTTRVGPAVAGDGASHVTFRLDGGRVPLLLSLAWEPGTDELVSLTVVPA